MEKEKELEGAAVTGNENPITELVTKWREYKNFLDKWTSKQSLPVKAAVNATTKGINYAGGGLVLGFWLNRDKEVKQFTSCPLRVPWIVARKFAPLGAVPASIYTVMEGLTGKKDITACILAGLSCGVIWKRAWGLKSVMLPSAIFTLTHVGAFKIENSNWGQHKPVNTQTYVEAEEKVSDQSYYRMRHMLSSLGLQDYENNFKKGLFTDETLPLLTYRDLQEVDIPAGARLRIIDYIKRGHATKKLEDLKATQE